MKQPARVIIVEDDPLFSDLLRLSLSHGGFQIERVVSDGAEAVELAKSLEIDAVLLDIELEGEMDGIDAAVRIREHKPDIGIVILSAHGEARYVKRIPFAESSGWAYLLKDSVQDVEAIARAVEGTIGGSVVLDSAIVSQMVRPKAAQWPELTPRLMEVVALLAEGYSNGAMAKTLDLTEKSIETYLSQIYSALTLTNQADINPRVAAARWFITGIGHS